VGWPSLAAAAAASIGKLLLAQQLHSCSLLVSINCCIHVCKLLHVPVVGSTHIACLLVCVLKMLLMLHLKKQTSLRAALLQVPCGWQPLLNSQQTNGWLVYFETSLAHKSRW
jgi:hypothetical protein